ncbi:MAG: SusD/RagB family nutrient-binding outer membrane lipoprotein, partial [Duncaniella sp.]|nr:SusD/RagB family nutrient-binding outer membrane lipoprotein [Duncaniella sp.]
MKLYKFIPAVALLLASCSEDEMDRINTDYANPPIEIINGKLMITDAITSTGFSTVSGDYSFYTSIYNEQLFGTGNNQMKNAELRQLAEVAGSSTFNNVWNSVYSNLLNLKSIIAKCGEGGLNEGQKDLLGMAQVLAAVNWGMLTDMHGDIPCSEALQGGLNKQPKLDKQEDIYKYIFALLDDAIDNLTEAAQSGMRNVRDQDILYGNDNAAWLAAAHAVKARYKLHMMKRDSNAAAEALAEAKAALDGGFEGMVLNIYDGSESLMSPWPAFQYSRDYMACSTTVQDLLAERNDPREDIYIYYYCEAEELDPSDPDYYAPLCGTPGNQADATASGAWDLSAPRWLTYDDSWSYPA